MTILDTAVAPASRPGSVEVVDCPGCDSIRAERCGSLAATFANTLNGEAFTQQAYYLCRCGNCGLYYKSNVADDEVLDRYYAQTDFRKWETAGLFPTEKAALKQLRLVPPGGRILDFGCSSGRLLARLTEHCECLGYDVNREAAEVAAAKGIRMLADPFDLPRHYLDAVVMVDVFEHLRRPTQVISALARLVKPGGMIVIVTGNGDAPVAREYLENFWYLRTIEHLTMFSRSYAEYLSDEIGALVAEWVEVSHYGWKPADQIFQRLRRHAYRSQQEDSRPLGARLIALSPPFRRARNWSEAPPFTCGADHVVAQFRIG